MRSELVERIFADTAYVRMGGSAEELNTAKYFQKTAAELGLEAYLESFEVDMATIKKATLTVDGKEIPCK